MEAAKYVGHVSALAVALGIGSAAAVAPAWAEPSETNSTSPSSAADNSPSVLDSPTGTPTDDTPSVASFTATPPTPAIAQPVVDSRPPRSSSGPEYAEEPKPRVLKRKTVRQQSTMTSTLMDYRTRSATSARVAVIQPPSARKPTASTVEPTASTLVASQAVAAAPDPIPHVAATTGTDDAVALEIAVAGPSAAPGTDVPVQSPAEWALLAAARREIGLDSDE